MKAALKNEPGKKIFYQSFKAKNSYKVGPLFKTSAEAKAAYRSPNALTDYELSEDESE